MNELEKKQIILINYIQSLVGNNWKVKAEYSTNDDDLKVITIQEQAGTKVVFIDGRKLYNYYMIDIYGNSIKEEKNLSIMLGDLIGNDIIVETTNENNKKEKWQLLFKQFSNFQAIEYLDIRRVGYNATLQCIINKIYEEE